MVATTLICTAIAVAAEEQARKERLDSNKHRNKVSYNIEWPMAHLRAGDNTVFIRSLYAVVTKRVWRILSTR